MSRRDILNLLTKLENILNDDSVQLEHYHQTDIYIVNPVVFNNILEYEKELINSNNLDLLKTFKILNRKPAVTYHFKMKKIDVVIKDPAKIKDKIETKFKAYCDSLLKHSPNNDALIDQLQKLKEKKDYVIENYDNLNLIMSNFKDSKYYPIVQFKKIEKEHEKDTLSKWEYLLKDKPNILFFDEVEKKVNNDELIKNSFNLFEDIYIVDDDSEYIKELKKMK